MLSTFNRILVTASICSVSVLANIASAQSTHHFKSAYPFEETVSRLESGIKEKGMSIFAVIDHAQAAKKADLTMPPTKVIIFGNPKAGTPLMVKYPTLALDLPLRVLVNQDKNGVNVIMHSYQTSFNNLQLPVQEGKALGQAEKLVQKLVTKQ
ncbi:MAG: DUF302 domain-containing protein [Advenella sp.]|uniref:DUF302 domain-containing protein n=1 Tax=unclassified Advenella TaxID=2685285 RepID=UPI00351C4D8B